MWSAPPLVPFEELQRTFAARYPASDPLDLEEGTVVVLPSLSFPTAELRKIVGIGYYEERLLFLLLLLRRTRVKVVYLTSMPVEEAVVDYYLSFLPDPAGARSRLHMLAVGDPAPRSLTAKLLDRPELLDRVRELCEGPGGAFVQPFNVTVSEQELSERLGVPLYGPAAALAGLGSKTGSRRVARLAGVPVLDGAEDLRSVEAVEAAARDLRGRPAPPVGSVVIKLNDGFSGQGNAVVDLAGLNGSLLDSPIVFCADEESWPSFAAKIVEGGAVVEELLDVPGLVSPSVQLRVLPGGTPLILSTHSQVLGGPNRQVYLGCRFPADPAYRGELVDAAERVGRVLAARGVIGYFGIDFFVVPEGGPERVFLSEINLRVGGTTHPFGMASLVTGGRYAAGGSLVAAGRDKSYLATDNLKSGSLVGCQPHEVIDRVDRLGLGYDARRRTGTTLHLLGALREYGKMGVTCIGDTEEEARQRYREVVAALT